MLRKLALALLAIAMTPVLAAAQARVLEPSSDWSLRQDDEYCRISRSFGEGRREVTMYFYSYGPTGSYQVILVGNSLPRNQNKARDAMLAWGDSADAEQVMVINGSLGQNGSITLRTYGNRPVFRFGRLWSGDSESLHDIPFDEEATQLYLDPPERDAMALQLGEMTAALDILADCERELLASWETGAADYRELATQPQLQNAQDVVEAIRWPPALLINRHSLFLQLRMTIGADGSVSDCVLQSPPMDERDVRAICRTFEGMARFAPATDYEGNPTTALFRTTYTMFVFD
ncbi:hypothetical protein OZN62_07390 [Aurantiacibacter sp. MUD11]|uniref:hypothetical protein n=1 Tax=Aurantiacibacter sp. MUD11 TaxID=3003265 RepID=UPI0022AAFD97|nr:hypothetical protein [Aurantiacibacter sp. MUD11]WAT16769.1 hypothetical protein OZN62_07390 [Aurantiacibacter sp. MUD11]